MMGEDAFGDGVNVAARLESLCDPGGVTISDAVFPMLDGTLCPAFDDAGKQALKNIAQPVQVWSRGGITDAAETSEYEKKAGFPVLNIVPVTVSDGRDEVRDLASALTHDLETYLESLRWLRIAIVRAPKAGAVTLTADPRAPVRQASAGKPVAGTGWRTFVA
jgi:adenylate cyclase